MNIEYLTNDIFIKFNGMAPVTTVKGIALIDEGEVYAICAITVIAGENFIIFDTKLGFSKRDIIRGWKVFKAMLDDQKTYYAIIDRELETAPKILEHFNFNHVINDIYIYVGE